MLALPALHLRLALHLVTFLLHLGFEFTLNCILQSVPLLPPDQFVSFLVHFEYLQVHSQWRTAVGSAFVWHSCYWTQFAYANSNFSPNPASTPATTPASSSPSRFDSKSLLLTSIYFYNQFHLFICQIQPIKTNIIISKLLKPHTWWWWFKGMNIKVKPQINSTYK